MRTLVQKINSIQYIFHFNMSTIRERETPIFDIFIQVIFQICFFFTIHTNYQIPSCHGGHSDFYDFLKKIFNRYFYENK